MLANKWKSLKATSTCRLLFEGTGHEMDLIFVDMHGLIRVFNFLKLLLQEKLLFTFLVVDEPNSAEQ